jgi:hypothetical protein
MSPLFLVVSVFFFGVALVARVVVVLSLRSERR